MHEVLKKCFGFDSFRTSQEEVCRAVTQRKDVLLVMPTGSGKSLCYQLPGIMLRRDDAGCESADRVDGGSGCEDAIARVRGRANPLGPRPGDITRSLPEVFRRATRLSVHCAGAAARDGASRRCSPNVSRAWSRSMRRIAYRPGATISGRITGHIGQHLPALRPAPVIALTATATPIVQRGHRAAAWPPHTP